MNWRNVRLMFLREVRDQLRDRRTLFMIAVLPLLLYPALGVGVMQLQITRSEQLRTVVVLGADELPPPTLLDGDRFQQVWFKEPAQAEQLRVVTEDSLARVEADRYQELADRLAAADSVREAHREFERLTIEHQAALEAGNTVEAQRFAARMAAADRRRSDLLADSGIQVLILVPEGMRDKLAEANARIRDRDSSSGFVDVPVPVLLHNSADDRSLIAYSLVSGVLDRWKQELLKDRLRMANLPESLPSAVEPRSVDLAQAEEHARSFWSKLFPALLVIMTLTGAFYPAVDLAAGEKERGTMETLLICPASRAEIVSGKFLTVMLFSVCTALLNLASMGLTGKYMASFYAGGALDRAGSFGPPPLGSLGWVIVLLVPIAALFSALCLALATFARSSKEGQYYLTPLLLVTVGLTFFCLMPTVEITPLYSLLPVVGVSLLLRELLAGNEAYVYLAPVLAANLGYAALALWWAIEQFSREDVLFREAERFELNLWLRHLLRDKDETPSFGEAGFCFVVIMLMQFGAMKIFADAMEGVPPSEFGVRTLQLLMVQQLVIVATPALLMGVMLTRSVRKTFRLRWPGFGYLAVGVVLPLALMPLSLTLNERLAWFFPPLPSSIQQTMALMTTDTVPLWLTLLAFAVAPAFCEEIAFRGFILSGFLRGGRTWLAIVLSSVAFGAMHMIPQQVFNATLLGIVLGLLAVRSRSLWPCICFHFVFNGSNVALGRYAPQMASEGFPPTLILACLLVAAVLIRWLIVTGQTGRPTSERKETAERAPAETEDLVMNAG